MHLLGAFFDQHLDALLVLAALLGAAYLNAKGKAGDALEYYERSNHVLTQQNHELIEMNKEYVAQITELKRKTDFDIALEPVLQGQRESENKADKRHREAMGVFNLIAQHLGAEE